MGDEEYLNVILRHVIDWNHDGPESYVKIEQEIIEQEFPDYEESIINEDDISSLSSERSFDQALLPGTRLSRMTEWSNLCKPIYAFSHPKIRSRLEKLMGSHLVCLDRKYMIKLQERIKQDHLENLKNRIKEREIQEVERTKKLILDGEISMENAPKELKNHPACKINHIARKILQNKRNMMKQRHGGPKITIRKAKKEDLTKQDITNSETEETHGSICEKKDGTRAVACWTCAADADVTVEVAKGLMFSKEEYEKLKYEAPLLKALKEAENVDDMYKLAEQIVGPLEH